MGGTNIFIYRIINDFVFGQLIKKIDPPTKTPFDKEFDKIDKKGLFKIIIFGLLLIVANILSFVYFKKDNLFEMMNLPRACTEDQIDKAIFAQQALINQMSKGFYYEQAKVQQRHLNEVKEILKNPARRMIYDKYGSAESQYAYYLTSQHTMQMILQAGINYLILLLVSIAGTGQQEKSIIKWQVLLIITFFMVEVHLLQSDLSKADLVDMIAPQLTLMQRLIIVKFLLVPAQIIVGYISHKLTPNKARRIQNKIMFLKDAMYGQIKQISTNTLKQPTLDEQQKQLFEQFDNSVTNQIEILQSTLDIVTEKNKKNESKWDIGSIVKMAVFGYIIYEELGK